MPVTIVTSPGALYPPAESDYSPGEKYPEYAHGEAAPAPNPTYAQVRRLLEESGLDAGKFGSPDWNPLGEWVPRGSRVFVLCNFVYHRKPDEGPRDFQAKCIHGSVLRALIDYLLIAVGPEGSVRFGNSALQSCDFPQALADTGADRVEHFYRSRALPVESRDLRLYVTERDGLGRINAIEHRDEAGGVEIDLADESWLAELPAADGGSANFRISDYDPRRTSAFHADGRHRYVVHRDILESDVVVSLSKLKTHEKVGITCGLKGFVGTVGHKDCLAHHRFGHPSRGGDEYPNAHAFLRPLSLLHEWVNQRGQEAPLQAWAQIADRNLRRLARRTGVVTTGAWWGNDTCWRMTLDLARIVHFANAQGQMCDAPQRRHLSLIDGIVAGEGEGPLQPAPVDAGVLLLGDDVPAVDRVAARLMGFDPERIPLIREAFASGRWSISDLDFTDEAACTLDGRSLSEREIAPVLGRGFRASRGWAPALSTRS